MKQIVVTFIKGTWPKIWFYIKEELLVSIKEAFPKAFKAFCEIIWKEIKEDVKACAKEIITDTEQFLTSVEGKQKEEAILDAIMAKIELPILLKPFKGLIRKIIKSKLDKIITEGIGKGKELIG